VGPAASARSRGRAILPVSSAQPRPTAPRRRHPGPAHAPPSVRLVGDIGITNHTTPDQEYSPRDDADASDVVVPDGLHSSGKSGTGRLRSPLAPRLNDPLSCPMVTFDHHPCAGSTVQLTVLRTSPARDNSPASSCSCWSATSSATSARSGP